MRFRRAAASKEQALPAINAKMLIPEGWYMKQESDDGVTVYQISREKAENEGGHLSAGLIVSVTTKVPDRASMKPSEYANDLFSRPRMKAMAPNCKGLRKDRSNA